MKKMILPILVTLASCFSAFADSNLNIPAFIECHEAPTQSGATVNTDKALTITRLCGGEVSVDDTTNNGYGETANVVKTVNGTQLEVTYTVNEQQACLFAQDAPVSVTMDLGVTTDTIPAVRTDLKKRLFGPQVINLVCTAR